MQISQLTLKNPHVYAHSLLMYCVTFDKNLTCDAVSHSKGSRTEVKISYQYFNTDVRVY